MMITKNELPEPETLATLVSRVTQTMFGLSFTLTSSGDPVPWAHQLPWRTVMLPIPGKRAITIAIAADQPGSQVLGSHMFSCAMASVDESMVDDSLRELANIIAGQVKNVMGLDQALGLPVIATKDEASTILGRGPWKAATLSGGGERVVVWVAVTEIKA